MNKSKKKEIIRLLFSWKVCPACVSCRHYTQEDDRACAGCDSFSEIEPDDACIASYAEMIEELETIIKQ